jgi:hypothetical protein
MVDTDIIASIAVNLIGQVMIMYGPSNGNSFTISV